MSGVCDFCCAPSIDWRYPANGFELEAHKWRSVGDWAACHTCSELIEAGDLDALAAWSIQTPKGNPRVYEAVLHLLRTTQAAFMVNRTGPRQRL